MELLEDYCETECPTLAEAKPKDITAQFVKNLKGGKKLRKKEREIILRHIFDTDEQAENALKMLYDD